MNTLKSDGGRSAYQHLFGSNLVDPSGRGDKGGDLLSAKDSPLLAREAGLNAAANSKLRLLLSYNMSLDCTEVKVGVTALS